VTEMKAVGSASDVVNVNASNTDNFMKQIMSMLGSSSVQDPMAAFTGGLSGLFGQAINGANPYAQAAQNYANAITPTAVNAALTPYNQENAYYSSGAVGSASKAAAEVQAGAAKDIVGMQTNLAGSLAGIFGNLLQSNQQNVMGAAAQGAAPEWWQPTYMEQNTGFGDFMGALGPIAGIASMFLPGIGPAMGAGLLANSFSTMTGRAPAGVGPMGGY
jgi:hypothetical protein